MRHRLKPLDEQVIVVTGATSGIGLAVARQGVARGAAMVLVARNAQALEQIAAELAADGGRVAVAVADVSQEAEVAGIASVAQAAFGGFDSWINNAAVGLYGTVEQIPIADHRQTFEVNYFGTLYGSLVATRHLRARGGGALINVGSILGDRTIVQQGPYAATKHAVQGLTDTLRMELERERAGISVTLIKPGGCATPFAEHARNYMDKPPRIPQPLYDPSVIADAILFCCEHPRRSIYIGSGGLLSSGIGQIAPRLTDWVMEAVGTRIQQRPGEDGDPAMRDNLYGPRKDGTVVDSRNLPRRHSSLMVKAQQVPGVTWLGLGLAAGAFGVIGKAVSRRF